MTRARLLWMLGGLAACAPAPEVVTDRLPMGRVGEVFSAAIVVEGGRGELTYAAEGLPGTITVNPAVGIVSGVPEFPGEYEGTVEVTDRAGRARSSRPR